MCLTVRPPKGSDKQILLPTAVEDDQVAMSSGRWTIVFPQELG